MINDTTIQGRTTTIATKVTLAAAELLKQLCAAKGMSLYQMQQMSLWSFIKYMSAEHNLTAEMEEIMSVFEHMDGWANALNMCDPDAHPTVSEAIYFLTAQGKDGCCAVKVNRPYFGDWKQTYNIQDIFNRFLQLALPELYRRMRRLADEMGYESVVNMLIKLVDEQTDEADLAEIRKTFEDADRSEYGVKPVAAPYRRKLNRSIETQTKLFSNDKD